MEFIFACKDNIISSCRNLHWRSIILTFLAILIFAIVLCSTFFPFKMIDNYFLLLPLSLSIVLISIFALLLSITKKSCFRFSLADFLFIIIVGYYAVRYDYQLQLANWKIIYAFLLLLLWFTARVIFSNSLNLKSSFIFTLICVGTILAIWGLLQLYGYQKSNHVLFSITGPFYNPGPYSGYIAMIIPLCLDRLFVSKGFLRYFYGFAFFLMLSIIPAGMSRSAWVAVIISCLWLLMVRLRWVKKIKQYAKKHPYAITLYSLLSLVTLLLVLFCFFQIKSASAHGRLFIWKNTITAISKQPIWGYGAGSFPSVYGHAQAAYFASGEYTELEEYVAGSPEYAFNECLQIGIEGGIFLLSVFLVFVIWILRIGIYMKEYGTFAALLSLFVFSLSSYPFQILSFGVTGVFLFTICMSTHRTKYLSNKMALFITDFLLLIVLLVSFLGAYSLRNLKNLNEQWYYANILRSNNNLDAAVIGYNRLYDRLKHNSDFLISYAKCLTSQKRESDAIIILKRALLVCNDPMLYNMLGLNYQSIGDFSETENSFKSAIHLLPGRIYPYYLLAKLYLEPDFIDKKKTNELASIVINKTPKVHSKAVDEMRLEMKALLDTLIIN